VAIISYTKSIGDFFMTYPYYMQNNPYYQPNAFAGALSQNYGNYTQQPQQQAQNSFKILAVATKEEATGAPVDLVNGIPSFFFNKSNGEIYIKQFDIKTGTPIFKTFLEVKQEENTKDIPMYEKQLNYLCNGVDSLHKMIANLATSEENSEVETKPKKKEGSK